MKYGYFDDELQEYVITEPRTPWPWINYLGSTDFFSLVSNTAGGYSFFKDALYRRLTRYRYNNVPIDSGGRYFYIVDGSSIWSPGWKPTRTELDDYSCRHGLGYTVIRGERDGIAAELCLYVPTDARCEVQLLTLHNQTSHERRLTVFSFLEWCLWNAEDDATNFQRNYSIGEVEIEGSTIFHKTGYRERRNHYAFYSAGEEIAGFDTDRESFIGLYNGFENPQAVAQGKSTNSIACGWAPIASHMLQPVLRPGQKREIVFILGYVEVPESEKWESSGIINKRPAAALIERFNTPEKVRRGLKTLSDYWRALFSNYRLTHPDSRLTRQVNVWNQYQCAVTFNLARSASYFESGLGRGLGFRDTSQDLLGFVHQDPARARERILDVAATQFQDGGAYHQYQPLTKLGNDSIGGNFNDDPLWLIASTAAYIKESGDWSVLDVQVPFDNDPKQTATLYEHLKRSFEHVLNNRGPNGLPLIGRADWNDCLNLNCFSADPNESFQTTENKRGGKAESVFIAGMLVLYGMDYVTISDRLGRSLEADHARQEIEKMTAVIKEAGWDGEWFIRAYDYFGRPVGSKVNNEGRIFIETQGICSMAGIGMEEEMPRQALDSVKKYLDSPYGIVMQQPAFDIYRLHLGEISSYPPGYKENAGVFCHNNPWIVIAEAKIGRGERAFEYYSKITPAYLEEISDLHRTEPYVYTQMIAGKDASRPGEGKNSWLTGTAAWSYIAVTQSILGVKPDFDGLRIDPCIPSDWDGYAVNRKYRGAVYTVRVSNPDNVSKGVKTVSLNGRALKGNLVPPATNGEHLVDVIMG